MKVLKMRIAYYSWRFPSEFQNAWLQVLRSLGCDDLAYAITSSELADDLECAQIPRHHDLLTPILRTYGCAMISATRAGESSRDV